MLVDENVHLSTSVANPSPTVKSHKKHYSKILALVNVIQLHGISYLSNNVPLFTEGDYKASFHLEGNVF